MGNVSVATPKWYPERRRQPARSTRPGGRARVPARACRRRGRRASAIASRMTWPMSLAALGAELRDRALDDRLEIVVGELRGQVALDQRGLALLGRGAVGVPGVVERLGGLAAALELAPQHASATSSSVSGRRASFSASRSDESTSRSASRRTASPDFIAVLTSLSMRSITHTLPTAARSPGASSTTSTRSPTPAPACARTRVRGVIGTVAVQRVRRRPRARPARWSRGPTRAARRCAPEPVGERAQALGAAALDRGGHRIGVRRARARPRRVREHVQAREPELLDGRERAREGRAVLGRESRRSRRP